MTAGGWTIRRTPAGGGQGSVDDLATSFELRAAEYARLRPDYPDAALDAAVPEAAGTVLDLAAGTGKLTAPLIDRGYDVIAVEPLPSMLAELRRTHPGAHAVAGTAEELPLADGTVDAVVVGQAFHWFDKDRALDGVARVLRPSGTIALLWNHDDEADPLVRDVEAALDRVGRPAGGSTGLGDRAGGQEIDPAAAIPPEPPFRGHRWFADPEVRVIRWGRRMSVEDFIALQHTYSYVIRASAALQAQLDSELPLIVRQHVGPAATVTVPVICQVWRSARR
ncbi:class I SAM-dependent methyltransferase [Nakamurella sp. GG22]